MYRPDQKSLNENCHSTIISQTIRIQAAVSSEREKVNIGNIPLIDSNFKKQSSFMF